MTHHAVPWTSTLLLGGLALGQTPRDARVVERVDRELVQVELRIEGPAERLAALRAEDLEVAIAGHLLTQFSLDRSCAGGTSADRAALSVPPEEPPDSTHRSSYLFYFDQHHLRIDGRARALELARSLVPEILRGGGRAKIVSAGLRVEVFSEWTEDASALLEALDRLEHDPAQVDTWAAQEDCRVAEVLRAFEDRRDLADGVNMLQVRKARSLAGISKMLNDLKPGVDGAAQAGAAGSISATKRMAIESARLIARGYQSDERFRTEHALERFTMTLSSLAEVARPKSVLYFADTVRSNPGEHFVRIFPAAEGSGEYRSVGGTIPAFDQVIRAAVASNVRLYTVQAAGLVDETSLTAMGTRALPYSGGPRVTSARFEDAKSALGGLAAETGGRTFLHGAGAGVIARELRRDLDCMYLLSFSPGDLPRDRSLPVLVLSRVPGLRVSSRPSVVVRGEATRRQERLASAFLRPDHAEAESDFVVSVIPIEAAKRGYAGLVQIALPPADASGVTWDVGATILGGERAEIVGHASVDRAGVPVIYEAQVEFAPGPFELVAVAYDVERDRVLSLRATGSWPDPGAADGGVGPLIALQPSLGAFVRGEEVRDRGSLGLDDRGAVDAGRPLAIVGIACGPKEFRVERRLVGESSTDFPPIEPAPGERCALFRDIVRAGTLGPGHFRYETEVRAPDGAVLARGERTLIVDGARGP